MKHSTPGNYETLIQSPVSVKTALISQAGQPDPLLQVYLTRCAIIPSAFTCDDSTGSSESPAVPMASHPPKMINLPEGSRIPGRKGVLCSNRGFVHRAAGEICGSEDICTSQSGLVMGRVVS